YYDIISMSYLFLSCTEKNEEEFILWLADFIDRITIDTSKGDYPIKKNLANLSSIAEKLMYRH
ncbi:hypothetical protein C5I38_10695, partial [Acinetobacter baumannii]